MITRRFIEKIHNIFDELGYRKTEALDFDEFEATFINTLTHCKDLSDAIDAIDMYQFCLKKWDKIEKIFRRKLQLFNQYDYEGNSLISCVDDDEAFGTYYITNGITKKINEVFIASKSFDEEMFEIDFRHGKFNIFSDSDYFIKYAKFSSSKMKLFNKNKKLLCNIILSEECGIFLENNCTKYKLCVYDDFVGVYERSYYDSLADTDIVDIDKLVADIEWDILEKDSELGIAKLNIYASNQDVEMLLAFAMSTFLIFQKYIQKLKKDIEKLKQAQKQAQRSRMYAMAYFAFRH